MHAMIVALVAGGAALGAGAEKILHFERERISDVIYEAAGVWDVNKDGALDIVSGEYWFPGPDFKIRHKICDIRREGDYYDDFSNYPMDVNGDGYLDIVTGGWWNKTMIWRENPKGEPREWTNHPVLEVGNVERNCFYDLDGDGHVEVFSTTAPVNFFRLKRDAKGRGAGEFEHYAITTGGGGHGFGFGDLNGDQRPDLIFSGGWLEGPADPFAVNDYAWHPIFNFGLASVPILVHDVNGDGKMDLIVGQGHDYGLAWYEQTGDPRTTEGWTKHDIETDRSQFHEMQLADIDNDGEPELITGKRWRAHNENDPGAADPVGLYYYEINGGAFQRINIDYGPADQASGTGIYLWIEDIDGNGWKDIVAPGKEGLYLFRNQGFVPDGVIRTAAAPPAAPEGEWKSLFNGSGLDGWEQVGGGDKSVWGVQDGLLYTDGEGGGWLSTKEEYADFEIELECRIPPGGNSGVFLRAPREGNPAFEGMEIQILDDAAEMYKDIQPWQRCGSLYAVHAPKENAVKPANEWQTLRIRCEGPRVQVWLNGVHIVDQDLATATTHHDPHPGLKRSKGYLGLQNHGSRLDFRNLRIRTL